jgi:hypothetical protein
MFDRLTTHPNGTAGTFINAELLTRQGAQRSAQLTQSVVLVVSMVLLRVAFQKCDTGTENGRRPFTSYRTSTHHRAVLSVSCFSMWTTRLTASREGRPTRVETSRIPKTRRRPLRSVCELQLPPDLNTQQYDKIKLNKIR